MLLVYEWGSLSEPLLCDALKNLGIDFVPFERKMKNYHMDADFARELMEIIHANDTEGNSNGIKAIFSYDYFPLISMICEINKIPYISWIYDCPQYTLQSETLVNSCNYIFCFDRNYCQRLTEMGAVHCIHFPLAAATKMYEQAEMNVQKECLSADSIGTQEKTFACDVSFVGNLYNDKKNRLRQALFSDYASGYIEGLVQAQLLVYGYNFIKDTLPEKVVKEVVEKCQLTLGKEYRQDSRQMAADAIGMEVSARERENVLRTISAERPVCLYTSSDLPSTLCNDNVRKMGPADYQKEVPLIFHNSKINLNITSKTIESGIPQRVFDILSCGGFCLTNYQPEMEEYFVDGEDLVMYTGMEDLTAKVNYYLEHEEERRQIAENGRRRVREEYGLEMKLKEMLELVMGEKI